MIRNGLLAAALVAAGILTNAGAADSRPLAFDVPHCKMTVYVHKQGVFSFLADEHEIEAPIASGTFDDATKAVELTVDATKMRVVDPKLSEQRRAPVQSNMEGTVLDVAHHPTISFRSTSVNDANPHHWTVSGELALRGQTQPVMVAVERVDATHFRGTATVRQSAFGITPIKVAGGVVSVRDDVDVTFDIALAP